MSAWPNQPLGGLGRNPLRLQGTNSSATDPAIAPAVCLSIAPSPNDSSPQTAGTTSRRSPLQHARMTQAGVGVHAGLRSLADEECGSQSRGAEYATRR